MSQQLQDNLLLCDIDAITQGPDFPLVPSDQTVLRLFGKIGGRMILLSRYTPWELSGLLEKFDVNVPIICCNGAILYDPAENTALYASCLNEVEAAKAIRDIVFRFPGTSAEIIGKDSKIYVVRNNQIAARHTESFNLPYQLMPLEEVPSGWVKVTFRSNPKQMQEILVHIHRKYYGAANYFVQEGEQSVSLFSVDARDDTAFRQLCRMKEYEPKDCTAILPKGTDTPLSSLVGRLVTGNPEEQGSDEWMQDTTLCDLREGGLGEYLYGLIMAEKP